jgi:hypothetical protein
VSAVSGRVSPEVFGLQQLLNAGEAGVGLPDPEAAQAAVRQICPKAAKRAAIGQTRPKAAHTDSLYADYSEPLHGHGLNWRRLVAYM